MGPLYTYKRVRTSRGIACTCIMLYLFVALRPSCCTRPVAIQQRRLAQCNVYTRTVALLVALTVYVCTIRVTYRTKTCRTIYMYYKLKSSFQPAQCTNILLCRRLDHLFGKRKYYCFDPVSAKEKLVIVASGNLTNGDRKVRRRAVRSRMSYL